jgi:hypothetical protein
LHIVPQNKANCETMTTNSYAKLQILYIDLFEFDGQFIFCIGNHLDCQISRSYIKGEEKKLLEDESLTFLSR